MAERYDTDGLAGLDGIAQLPNGAMAARRDTGSGASEISGEGDQI